MSGDFDPPITVRFSEDGAENTFMSVDQLDDWVGTELENWGRLREARLPRQTYLQHQFDRLHRELTEISGRIQQYRDGENESAKKEERDQIAAQLQKFSEHRRVRMDGRRGVFILGVLDDDPELAVALARVWDQSGDLIAHAVNQVGNDPWRHTFDALMRAYSVAEMFDQGISKNTARAEKGRLTKLQSEWAALLNEQREAARSVDADLEKRAEALDREEDRLFRRRAALGRYLARVLRQTGQQIDEYRVAYEEKIHTRAPVAYWRRQALWHLAGFGVWSVVFLAVASGAVYGFWIWREEVVPAGLGPLLESAVTSGAEGPGTASLLAALVQLSVPAFFIIWVLRFVARQVTFNVAQRADARERVVMTQTYIALVEEGKATDEDRILILHALFRPGAGAGAEDLAPPHWFDLLTNRSRISRGGD